MCDPCWLFLAQVHVNTLPGLDARADAAGLTRTSASTARPNLMWCARCLTHVVADNHFLNVATLKWSWGACGELGRQDDRSIALGTVAMTTIRAARESDAPAMAELLAQLGYPSSVASIPMRLAKLHTEGGVVLVAVSGRREVVGVASAVSYAALHTDTPVAYITALVTNENVRGRGVGRRMVSALEQWAHDRGCPRLSVTSGEHRMDAHAFYSQCGFSLTGRRFTKNFEAPAF